VSLPAVRVMDVRSKKRSALRILLGNILVTCDTGRLKKKKIDFRMILKWILARWFVRIGRECNWFRVMSNCDICH
jgi:hypothetical protein